MHRSDLGVIKIYYFFLTYSVLTVKTEKKLTSLTVMVGINLISEFLDIFPPPPGRVTDRAGHNN